MRRATATRLPARYEQYWGTEFWTFVNAVLRPGVSVLDVGSGRRPTLSPEERPEGSQYVGLDISGSELETAPPGSYDEAVVSEAEEAVPALVDRFDLIVAWQVLEHFRDMRRAADAFLSYAREGGNFVACLSGRNAAYAVANRILPATVGKHVVARIRNRPLETVFPAYYDRCDERGLRDAFSGWDDVRIIPLWRGAGYLEGFPRLMRLYVRYEDWAAGRGLTNLATHYVIAARKGERAE